MAKPSITIAHNEELFADDVGELWSPATVTLEWPSANRLQSPSVAIHVIASARDDMSLAQLREAQLQAAHDVLGAR